MRIAVARRKLRELRSEAEQLSWHDEADVIKRAENAMNKGGALTEWRGAHSQARSFIVEVATNMTNWRKELAQLESVFDDQTQQLLNTQSRFLLDDPKQIVTELREYASEGAYNDERQTFLELSHKLSTLLRSADELPDNETAEMQFNKGKKQILTGIRESIDLIAKLVDTAEEDQLSIERYS